MKKIFVCLVISAFLGSSTFAFAKPKDKDMKLNRGQVQSSVNKVDKLLDLDDDDKKGKKSGKKDKKNKKDKDSQLEKSVKKESRNLLKKSLK